MSTLTPEEIAEDLQRPTEAVMGLLREHVIPGFKVGRYWRVDGDVYAEWKRARSAPPDDPHRIPPRSAQGMANLDRPRKAG